MRFIIFKINRIALSAAIVLLTAVLLLSGICNILKSVNTYAKNPAETQTKMTVQSVKIKYSILIDTEARQLYLLGNGRLVKSYKCAVGKYETPSPLGSYKITGKAHWGEGFGGCWMGINCPWGNYGIHGTKKPESVGSAASHGCFRMYNSDIEELYNVVPVGTCVIITGGSYGPFGSGFRTIGPSSYGLDVQTVQKRLKSLGYFYGYCSGIYDSDGFKEAVHRYQRAAGLPVSDYIGRKMLNSLGYFMME